MGVAGFVKLQVAGEELERANRQCRDDRLLDRAEPAHEPRREAPRNAIRELEVEAVVACDQVSEGAQHPQWES